MADSRSIASCLAVVNTRGDRHGDGRLLYSQEIGSTGGRWYTTCTTVLVLSVTRDLGPNRVYYSAKLLGTILLTTTINKSYSNELILCVFCACYIFVTRHLAF